MSAPLECTTVPISKNVKICWKDIVVNVQLVSKDFKIIVLMLMNVKTILVLSRILSVMIQLDLSFANVDQVIFKYIKLFKLQGYRKGF